MFYSLLKIAWANIARRKNQSIILGLSLWLSVLLFASTLSYVQAIYKPFDTFFEQMQASHLLLTFELHEHDATAIKEWFLKQNEVEKVGNPTPFYLSESATIFQESEIDKSIQFYEYFPKKKQDSILIVAGKKELKPSLGDVWIPKHLANSYGISLGDSLLLPIETGTLNLKVSALVNDPHYASPLFNPTRAWVAPGSLSFYFPSDKLSQVSLGVRLHQATNIDTVWAKFNQAFLYSGNMNSYHLFKSVFLSFYNILAVVLVLFSILALVITGFVLTTVLSRAIRNDYFLIGVYKALGYTGMNLIGLYCLQNVLILFSALLFGLPLSYALTFYGLQQLSSSLGLSSQMPAFYMESFATILFFLATVVLISVWKARKAVKIPAVEAIRFGMPYKKYKPDFFAQWMHKLSVTTFIGIKMSFAFPKRLINTLVGVAITAFLLLFVVNLAASFEKLKENRTLWGFEDADVFLQRNESIALPLKHKDLYTLLQEDKDAGKVVPFEWVNATQPGTDQVAPNNLFGKAYDADLTETGLENLYGNHPKTAGEISLCLLTAIESKKHVGDSIELFIEGQLKKFLVCGIYQDISNLGQGFRMHFSAYKYLNPIKEPSSYLLKIKTGRNPKQVKEQLQARFGETIYAELSIADRKDVISLISSMKQSLLLISVFFLLIASVLLYNDAVASIDDFKKSIGVLQAIGLTSKQIRTSVLIKTLLVTLFGSLLGLLALKITSIPLVNQLGQGLGFQQFPYVTTPIGMMVTTATMLLLMLLTSWWATKRVLQIKVRNLVTE